MSFKHITIQDYKTRFFEGNTQHLLIDVRTTGEFQGGHLPNAVNIPVQELPNRLNEIQKELPLVFVCATGNRSTDAAKWLVKHGYSDVYNLKGGTMMWMMAGLPLERPGR